MVKATPRLSFQTDGQSLYGPGAATDSFADSGETLIFRPDEGSFPIDLSILSNSFTAEAFVDLAVGLYAFARLPSAGSWSATVDLEIDVDHPGGNLVRTDGLPDTFGLFDTIPFALGAAIESQGFSLGAEAGLHLILGLEAGIRNGVLDTWFYDEHFANPTLIDLDWSELLESSIPLITVSTAAPELELELTQGVTPKGQLPSDADTEAKVSFESGGPLKISASGASRHAVHLAGRRSRRVSGALRLEDPRRGHGGGGAGRDDLFRA